MEIAPSNIPLGQLLLHSGAITQHQLDRAVATQRAEGGSLGRILLYQGSVGRRELYGTLAQQSGIE